MRPERTSKLTPKGLPPGFPDSEIEPPATWEGQSVDWEALVAQFIHPVKVAIIEALAWVGRPLSATLMQEMFDSEDLYLSLVSYHANSLADMGVLELVVTRPARGAVERFYFFPEHR